MSHAHAPSTYLPSVPAHNEWAEYLYSYFNYMLSPSSQDRICDVTRDGRVRERLELWKCVLSYANKIKMRILRRKEEDDSVQIHIQSLNKVPIIQFGDTQFNYLPYVFWTSWNYVGEDSSFSSSFHFPPPDYKPTPPLYIYIQTSKDDDMNGTFGGGGGEICVVKGGTDSKHSFSFLGRSRCSILRRKTIS